MGSLNASCVAWLLPCYNEPRTKGLRIGLLLIVVACSGSNKSTTTQGAVIGASGGTVSSSSGATIEVPAGALSGDQTFAIEQTEESIPAGGALDGKVYRLKPEGVTFAKPVRVTLPVTLSTKKPVMLRKSGSAAWQPIAINAPGDTKLSAYTSRFSLFAVFQPTDEAIGCYAVIQGQSTLSCASGTCTGALSVRRTGAETFGVDCTGVGARVECQCLTAGVSTSAGDAVDLPAIVDAQLLATTAATSCALPCTTNPGGTTGGSTSVTTGGTTSSLAGTVDGTFGFSGMFDGSLADLGGSLTDLIVLKDGGLFGVGFGNSGSLGAVSGFLGLNANGNNTGASATKSFESISGSLQIDELWVALQNADSDHFMAFGRAGSFSAPRGLALALNGGFDATNGFAAFTTPGFGNYTGGNAELGLKVNSAINQGTDGQVVLTAIAGGSETSVGAGVAVVRMNADGSLDDTFDGDGWVYVVDSVSSTQAMDWVRDTFVADVEGSLWVGVAGTDSSNSTAGKGAFFFRLTADGAIDTTFNSDGSQLFVTAPVTSFAKHIPGSVQYGLDWVNGSNTGKITRFDMTEASGVDASFGTDGTVTIANSESSPYLVVQADEKLVIAYKSTTANQIVVKRLMPNGSDDASFPSLIIDGTAVNALVLQASGHAVLAYQSQLIQGQARLRLKRIFTN